MASVVCRALEKYRVAISRNEKQIATIHRAGTATRVREEHARQKRQRRTNEKIKDIRKGREKKRRRGERTRDSIAETPSPFTWWFEWEFSYEWNQRVLIPTYEQRDHLTREQLFTLVLRILRPLAAQRLAYFWRIKIDRQYFEVLKYVICLLNNQSTFSRSPVCIYFFLFFFF